MPAIPCRYTYEEPYDEKRPVVCFDESPDIVSIGMTIRREAKMSAETIWRRTDEALYLPKFAERNTFRFIL